jgi:hypothetical protein
VAAAAERDPPDERASAGAERTTEGFERGAGFLAVLRPPRDLAAPFRVLFGAAFRAALRRLAVLRFAAGARLRDVLRLDVAFRALLCLDVAFRAALRLDVAFRGVLRLRADARRAPPVRFADVREVFREPPRPPFFAFLAT